jgi:hypothetical protein
MVAGVQQDGIGSFGADPMQLEEFFPKFFRGAREQFCERALVLSIQKRNKDFQPFGFLTEIAGESTAQARPKTHGGSLSH